jgi:hypothetical protein
METFVSDKLFSKNFKFFLDFFLENFNFFNILNVFNANKKIQHLNVQWNGKIIH